MLPWAHLRDEETEAHEGKIPSVKEPGLKPMLLKCQSCGHDVPTGLVLALKLSKCQKNPQALKSQHSVLPESAEAERRALPTLQGLSIL